jgi:hypothetical protein
VPRMAWWPGQIGHWPWSMAAHRTVSGIVNGLRELGPRQHHADRHLTRLAPVRVTEDLQPVVASSRRPPGRARIEVDRGGRVTHRVEGTGVPARERSHALGDLVREVEVEVRLAEGWLGDALNLLQRPRAQVSVGGHARANRLPRPGEPDAGQMDVDSDKVQGGRKRDRHHRRDRPAEYQAHGTRAAVALTHSGTRRRRGREPPPCRPDCPGWRCRRSAAAMVVAPWAAANEPRGPPLFLCFARVISRWPGN